MVIGSFHHPEDFLVMQWSRSNTLVLASHMCAQCQGLGLRENRRIQPCDCVLRAIFRICYERFERYATGEARMANVTLQLHSGPNRRGTWGRKEEEYMADFLSVAKRSLTEAEHKIFRYHFLLGADYRLCIRKLGGDKGNFFHAVYRIQQKLGRAYAELKPYALFPLADYFSGGRQELPVQASPKVTSIVRPLRPPVRETGPVREEPERKAA